jgi:hypothetical protein
MTTVHMHGGPADGKSYDYPCANVATPETLVLQGLFDGVFKVVDYQRRPKTYDYYVKD